MVRGVGDLSPGTELPGAGLSLLFCGTYYPCGREGGLAHWKVGAGAGRGFGGGAGRGFGAGLGAGRRGVDGSVWRTQAQGRPQRVLRRGRARALLEQRRPRAQRGAHPPTLCLLQMDSSRVTRAPTFIERLLRARPCASG